MSSLKLTDIRKATAAKYDSLTLETPDGDVELVNLLLLPSDQQESVLNTITKLIGDEDDLDLEALPELNKLLLSVCKNKKQAEVLKKQKLSLADSMAVIEAYMEHLNEKK